MKTEKEKLFEERRGTVRHPHACAVSFTTLGSSHNLPDESANLAQTIDTSSNGMRISTSYPFLKQGFMLKMLIQIPGDKITVPVIAEVRWVKEIMPDNYQAGLRYLLQ